MYVIHVVGLSVGWMGKQIFKFRLKTAIRTDERGRLMSEIISGIRMIKMYTWENFFVKLVDNARMYVSTFYKYYAPKFCIYTYNILLSIFT